MIGSRSLIGCCAALLLLAPHAAAPPKVPDLEVGVPPGSPTEWAGWIPAITPRREPLLPKTAPRQPVDRSRTVVNWPRVRLQPQIGGAGMLRITTADVTGHLTWVNGPPQPAGPITGPAARALPPASPTLQWIGTAAFLRLLLHRQQVSQDEIVAHLVELGEPSLWSTDAAMAEPALVDAANQVRRRVEPRGGGTALPPGADLRERMLLRFVVDELGATHPFDPEGGFGLRLFAFADEIEPLLIRFARTDADPFLVRNAVAALGRFRTATAQAALVEVAAATEDPVCLMRALAALEPGSQAGPLLARLDGNGDPVERAALVAALGRIAAGEAMPAIVAAAHVGLRGDPDLLLTALTALTRLPIAAAESGLPALARSVRRAARTSAGRFAVEQRGDPPQPDKPDTAKVRGEILEQLALLLLVRCGGDAGDLAELQQLLPDARAGRRGNVADGWPPVQLPLVDTLAWLGDDGLSGLRSIVEAAACDPVVRVAALARLPAAERDALAARFAAAAGRSEPGELRLAAVQVLDHDGAAVLIEVGRAILVEAAHTPPDAATTTQRSLWLAALQALDRREALRAEQLLPLLEHVRTAPRQRAGATAALRAQLQALAEQLVADAARLRGRALDTRTAELVDLAIASGLDRRFAAGTREASIQYVKGLLAGLRQQAGNAAYAATVARAIADYFVPDQSMALLAGNREVRAVVPFEEAVLLALGRTREPAAVEALDGLLTRPDFSRRAHACLAAAATGDAALLRPLLQALLDDDGFVRFCAHEALRHLTGRDVPADWMYGDVEQGGAAAQMWFRLCRKTDR